MRKEDFRLVECQECGMVYANPVAEEFANASFYNDSATEYYLSPDKLAADFSPVRYAREIAFFREHCLTGKILDVGCSTGGFLYSLNQRYPGNYEIFGMDASLGALKVAESRGIRVPGPDFLQGSFKGIRFDAITFWAVLEHLIDPRAYLDRAAELLVPGGTCFALVPNFHALAVRILGQKYRYILPQHVNYFTRSTLRQLVGSRFQILQLTTSHFNPMVILQDFRQKRGFVPDEQRALLLARTNRWKQSGTLLRGGYKLCEALMVKFGWADNLICALRKR
jgi:2-polyprenyl-3-methyl-5-hydroxy-6-metoxy-1,4-benzoquinol methylase